MSQSPSSPLLPSKIPNISGRTGVAVSETSCDPVANITLLAPWILIHGMVQKHLGGSLDG